MDEASMCERLALIQQGRILSKGTPAGILSDYSGRLLSVRTGDIYKAKLALENAADVDDVYIFGESLHVKTQNLEPARVERLLAANSVEVFDIKVIPPTIEDVFLAKLQS
jgi:ABC-type multidrug transport system ATPase subunit